jgi:hypothetical protein
MEMAMTDEVRDKFNSAFKAAKREEKLVDPQFEIMCGVIASMSEQLKGLSPGTYVIDPSRQTAQRVQNEVSGVKQAFAKFSHDLKATEWPQSKGTRAHARETNANQPLRETKDRARRSSISEIHACKQENRKRMQENLNAEERHKRVRKLKRKDESND